MPNTVKKLILYSRNGGKGEFYPKSKKVLDLRKDPAPPKLCPSVRSGERNIESPYTGRDFVQFGKTKSVLNKGARKSALLFNPPSVLSLEIMVKFRNVCAHGERLFTYRTTDSIPNLPIHMKLKIAQKGTQYVNGKNDLFSVVIALRYMLSDSWYKEFIKELKALIDKYLKKHDSISEQELYEKMGFPENWRKITRYRKQ